MNVAVGDLFFIARVERRLEVTRFFDKLFEVSYSLPLNRECPIFCVRGLVYK